MPPATSPQTSKVLGALLGVHAGDSLGATLEFTPWSEIIQHHPNGLRSIIGGGPFSWPAGHATDDTDLTRAVLLAYLSRAQSRSADFNVAQAAAEHALKWRDGDWSNIHTESSRYNIARESEATLPRLE